MAVGDSQAKVPDPERIALATFALLAAGREERVFELEPRSVEVTLAKVGFTPAEVQALTGGNRKTIASRMNKGKGT
jgi:hypothetical protein